MSSTGVPVEPSDASQAVHPADTYEFTAHENQVIGRLAEKMTFVGLFLLALGVLIIAVGAVRREYVAMGSGLFFLLLGIWSERAGHRFKGVVTTQGHDIRHLMAALEDVRKLYTVIFWICLTITLMAIILLTAPYVY
ncbi:MAG: hypothetical protein U0835_25785 [Isosphaeraceae bacterium]